MQGFAAIDIETANNERSSVCSVGVVGDSGYHNLDIIAARCGYEIKNHTMPWLMRRRVRLLRWNFKHKVHLPWVRHKQL